MKTQRELKMRLALALVVADSLPRVLRHASVQVRRLFFSYLTLLSLTFTLSLSHAACSAVKVRRRPTSLRLSIGGRRVQIRSVSLGTAQAKAVAIQCSFEALSRPVVQTICHIRSTLNPMRFSQIFSCFGHAVGAFELINTAMPRAVGADTIQADFPWDWRNECRSCLTQSCAHRVLSAGEAI